jgi:hypothetical protein
MDGTLCGVWIDGDGKARVSVATADGGRVEVTEPFEPFRVADLRSLRRPGRRGPV